MADFETFVIAVYVMVDEFQQTQLPPEPRRRGRRPGLCRSELMTLALISQPDRFASERAFARFAGRHLRALFPGLPDRTQLNRLLRRQQAALETFGRWLARHLGALTAPYEVLDTTAVPIRNTKRRGVGVLPEAAARGWSLRLGWFTGFRLLLTCTPEGVITGFGLAAGNEQDRTLAEPFFAQRAVPEQTVRSVGRAASGIYLADTGFAGRKARAHWVEWYDAHVYAPPQPDSAERWPRALRGSHTAARQIIETVIQRLHQPFRLERDRPRTLGGLMTRLAAKVALHNGLIAWNRQAGRPDLALAEVIGW